MTRERSSAQNFGSLDPLKLETYLSFAQFTAAFGQNPTEFEQLPHWRQNRLKKELKIF